MTDVERNILEALIQLDRTVESMPAADPKPSLLPLFDRIEILSRELPRGTSAELLHYLKNKSYQKARLWLQGRDAENAEGSCRH